MSTTTLTGQKLASTITADGVVLGIRVFLRAGALPAAGLEQVIEGVRALDMDAIRAHLARQHQPA